MKRLMVSELASFLLAFNKDDALVRILNHNGREVGVGSVFCYYDEGSLVIQMQGDKEV